MVTEPAVLLHIQVDPHTQNRIEALKLLMHESRTPFLRERILREALHLGLDLLLGEWLATHQVPLSAPQGLPRGN